MRRISIEERLKLAEKALLHIMGDDTLANAMNDKAENAIKLWYSEYEHQKS